MYRIELNREVMSRVPITKDQSRRIDLIEMQVFENIQEAPSLAWGLNSVLHNEVNYRIVDLGKLEGAKT